MTSIITRWLFRLGFSYEDAGLWEADSGEPPDPNPLAWVAGCFIVAEAMKPHGVDWKADLLSGRALSLLMKKHDTEWRGFMVALLASPLLVAAIESVIQLDGTAEGERMRTFVEAHFEKARALFRSTPVVDALAHRQEVRNRRLQGRGGWEGQPARPSDAEYEAEGAGVTLTHDQRKRLRRVKVGR